MRRLTHDWSKEGEGTSHYEVHIPASTDSFCEIFSSEFLSFSRSKYLASYPGHIEEESQFTISHVANM